MLFINCGVFGIWLWIGWLKVCLFLHTHVHMHSWYKLYTWTCSFKWKLLAMPPWGRNLRMSKLTLLESVVSISSCGKSFRIGIGKCSPLEQTLSIWACNGWGSRFLTSPLGTTMRNSSDTFLADEPKHAYSEITTQPLDRASRGES